MKRLALICLILMGLGAICKNDFASSDNSALGLFDEHRDIGAVGKPGSVEYDSTRQSYSVTGGGENMWASSDAFHFVWKQMSGDVSLAANIRWAADSGQPHRKACLIIRQSLDPDSPYADAAIHGNGLVSLQYREERGGLTHEIQVNPAAPLRIRLEKEGDYVFVSLARDGEALHYAGGSLRIKLGKSFFVGLGVCAHDNKAAEKAVFSNVEIVNNKQKSARQPALESTLETIAISSKDRTVVYHTRDHIEAPNWSRDGKYFLFNMGGKIYQLSANGGEPALLDSGFASHCNNDHGISPDGAQLALSDQSEAGNKSLIYILPISGGTPRKITNLGPSYWHGWSPDGKTLAYCAERNGEFDIYTIPAAGGEEKRLTNAPGLDDGPDYSPDGRYIYFNSERTGLMQIWRMNADGSQQQQVTSDKYNNWFAHPSPDGKWIVFLTFEPEVKGHPANQNVMLRLMPVGGGQIQTLAKFFGGQGTINVPSWSPDSKNIAFVSYRLIN